MKKQKMSAFERRVVQEELAKEKKCGVTGCTNLATHTWSGHPTCDDCGTPGRTGRAVPTTIKFEA